MAILLIVTAMLCLMHQQTIHMVQSFMEPLQFLKFFSTMQIETTSGSDKVVENAGRFPVKPTSQELTKAQFQLLF